MPVDTTLNPTQRASTVETTSIVPIGRRISWGAVLAGVTMALVVQVLLAMLGAAIGLSMVDPGSDPAPEARTFGMGAAIYWAVSMLIAMYIGGWVAGHMAGIPTPADGRLHGLLAWALTTLLTLYLLTSTVGGVIGGAFNLVSGAAAQTAQAASNANSGAVGSMVERAKDVARSAGVNVDAQRPGEVLTEQQKAEAAQKSRQAADAASAAGARAGMWGFIALVLGAVAAAWGGASGRPRDVVAVR